MYSVEYLPLALRDLQEIARYIAHALKNPAAAERTVENIVRAVDQLSDMPYRRAAYTPIRPLKHEYRTMRCATYVAFYWIEEDRKTVVVARVLYAKANISKRLSEAERLSS